MLPLYGRLFGSTVDNMIRVGEAWGEILALSPRVMVMRTDAALAAMVHPPVALDGEPVRMVVEKFDALAEGAVAATLATGQAIGGGLMGFGTTPFDAAVDIAMAAVAPTRGRLRANVRRLSGEAETAALPAAAE